MELLLTRLFLINKNMFIQIFKSIRGPTLKQLMTVQQSRHQLLQLQARSAG